MNVLLDQGRIGKDADGKDVRLFSEKQSREMWTAQTPMKISEPKPALAATQAELLRLWPGLPAARLQGPQDGHARRRAAGLLFARAAGAGREAGHRDPDQRRKRRLAERAAVPPARPVPGRGADRLDQASSATWRSEAHEKDLARAEEGQRHPRGQVAAVAAAGVVRRRVPGRVVRHGDDQAGRARSA